jgi:hypothetical protein
MGRLGTGFGRGGALALAGLLAACGGTSAPGPATAPCPRIAILADGADLTRYRPGAPPDLTAMTIDARIAGFEARCDYTGRGREALEVRITPRFDAERGPAAESRTAELPWFVAVTDAADTAVLERVSGTTQVSFPSNVARALVTGRPALVTLPIGEGQRAVDYIVRLSFQLTPGELEMNRRRGPR